MSETLQIGIISGLISSIIATGILSFFVIVYKEIIIPRIRTIFYSGIDISGEWQAEGETKNFKWNSIIQIEQTGTIIKGTITNKTKPPPAKAGGFV